MGATESASPKWSLEDIQTGPRPRALSVQVLGSVQLEVALTMATATPAT